MLHLFIEKDFESKGRKRKTKKKNREHKKYDSYGNIFSKDGINCSYLKWICTMLWSRGGSNDKSTRKWVIRNILKENSTSINDTGEKPIFSLIQSWILAFLVTAHWVYAEESLASICHMRASPSVGEVPRHSNKDKYFKSQDKCLGNNRVRLQRLRKLVLDFYYRCKWTSLQNCNWRYLIPYNWANYLN